VSATLTANYAIFYETRELWEAKGDVVIIQNNGRRLYTSQLFWNQSLHRIYSNVDSRVVDGDEIYDCEGFESDEQMKDWTYRKLKGVTYVNDTEFGGEDSSANDSSASNAEIGKKSSEVKNPQGELKPIPRPVRTTRQNTDSNGPVKPLRNSEQRAMSLELPEKR
jgi:hypothetical protein